MKAPMSAPMGTNMMAPSPKARKPTAEKNNEDLAVTDLNNNNTFKYYTKA